MRNNPFPAIFGVITLFLLTAGVSSAQPCYPRFRSEGIAAYEAMQFDSAINKFEAAKICDDKPRSNDIDDWIIKAQNGYIDAINAARKEAETARDAEAAARKEAEANAARARFNALNARALLALEKQDPNIAFALAKQAKRQARQDSLSNQDLSVSVLPEVYYNGFFTWKGGFYSPPFYKDLDTLPSQIQEISLHPQGDMLLLTARQLAYALLLDHQGNEIRRFEHDKPVHQARFSPDGTSVLTASRDGSVHLWDLQGRLLQAWQEGLGIGNVRFSADGLYVLISNGRGKFVDLAGEEAGKPFGSGIYDTRLSPDGTYIFTQSGTDAQLWQWKAGKGAKLRYTFSHQPGLGLFAPDSRHLITAYRDSLQVWRIEKSGKKLVLTGSQTAHEGTIYSLELSQDQQYVISAGRDQALAIWKLSELLQSPQAAQPLLRLRGHHAPVRTAVLGKEGKVFSGGDDQLLKSWELPSKAIPTLANHQQGERVRALAISSLNGQVVLGLEDKIQIKDPKSLVLITESTLRSPLTSLSFSHQGNHLAGLNRDKEVIVWAWEKGILREVARRNFPNGQSLAFFPEENLIAIVWGPNASVWDWKEDDLRLSLDHHEALQKVATSPDGSQWLVGAASGKVWLWPWKVGKPAPLPLPPHQGAALGLAFSPDGQTFLATSADGSAWIKDGTFQSLLGHTGPVLTGQFSPQGNLLATGSADGLVILWNLHGEELFRLPRLSTFVEQVCFSPDGKLLYLRDSAGRALQWDLDPED